MALPPEVEELKQRFPASVSRGGSGVEGPLERVLLLVLGGGSSVLSSSVHRVEVLQPVWAGGSLAGPGEVLPPQRTNLLYVEERR